MSTKTKAYRKTPEGWRIVKRSDFLSLNKTDRIIFRDTQKPFYLEPDDRGPRLTFAFGPNVFKYYPEDTSNFHGSSEESETHKYCIQEIAKRKTLKIIPRGNFYDFNALNPIEFTFNYCFSEIVLPIGEHFIKPDLLLYIREPSWLALKWNRIVAIEIVVTHDLDGEKLELLKNSKIPVLRIRANRNWGKKKEHEMSKEQKEKLRNWIKNTFANGYSADILMDPSSKSYLENKTITDLEKQRKELLYKLKQYSQENEHLKEGTAQKTKELQKSEHTIYQLKKMQTELVEELKSTQNNLADKVLENKQIRKEREKASKFNTKAFTILIVLILLQFAVIYFYI